VGKAYETPEDLICEVTKIIQSISQDVLKSAFESWKGRSSDCWNSGDEYVE
jgi:hypothetical protein